jgi:hypothetical protein
MAETFKRDPQKPGIVTRYNINERRVNKHGDPEKTMVNRQEIIS